MIPLTRFPAYCGVSIPLIPMRGIRSTHPDMGYPLILNLLKDGCPQQNGTIETRFPAQMPAAKKKPRSVGAEKGSGPANLDGRRPE